MFGIEFLKSICFSFLVDVAETATTSERTNKMEIFIVGLKFKNKYRL